MTTTLGTSGRATPLQLLRALDTHPRDQVHLVARPAGVVHAYVGPLTPSGRHVPRAGRTVCRAHTRRLHVLERTTVTLGRRESSGPQVCARCSARLTLPRVTGGPSTIPTRDDALRTYADTTAFDLAVQAWMAETPEDLERVEWLALLVVGFPACATEPVVSPGGKVTGPLDDHITRARARVGAHRGSKHLADVARENREIAVAAGKATRHAAWKERQDRITRLGFVNATA